MQLKMVFNHGCTRINTDKNRFRQGKIQSPNKVSAKYF
jgi:hypothetical protein